MSGTRFISAFAADLEGYLAFKQTWAATAPRASGTCGSPAPGAPSTAGPFLIRAPSKAG